MADSSPTPPFAALFTVNNICGIHTVFAETGEKRLIQHQLITPATIGSSCRRHRSSLCPYREGGLRLEHTAVTICYTVAQKLPSSGRYVGKAHGRELEASNAHCPGRPAI